MAILGRATQPLRCSFSCHMNRPRKAATTPPRTRRFVAANANWLLGTLLDCGAEPPPFRCKSWNSSGREFGTSISCRFATFG
eukprot:5962267-Amphidinium_carterae.1